MRIISARDAGGHTKYRRCRALQPLNDYPAIEVRMYFEDFADLHDAFPDPGIRGWLEKMMAIFPEATSKALEDAQANETEKAELPDVQAAQDPRRF